MTGHTTETAATPVPPVDEGRMLRFLAAAGGGLAGVLALSAALVLLGGWLDATVGLIDPADVLQRAAPGLAVALDGFSFVADVGRNAGWALLPGVTVALLIRRLPGLAGFVAVAAAGAVLLGETGAILTVLWQTGEGSGGAGPVPVYDDMLGLTVNSLAGMLVLLPLLSARARVWLVGGLAVLVLGFGVLAVASGFGTLVATTGGLIVGILWSAVVTVAYRKWGLGLRGDAAPLRRGLPVEAPAALRPAPDRDRVLYRAHGVAVLLVSVVLIGAALIALGLLGIVPSAAVQRFDEQVIGWFTDRRNPVLTDAATIIDAVGNTPGILAVHLAALPIVLALTRRRAPAVFLLTALIGETGLYIATGILVSRDRPDVDHLGMGVPVTSGYPSGHVAASLVTYCGIALLMMAWSRSRWRHAALPVALLLVLGVAWARLYWGLHYPTDNLTSIVYAAAWLAVCWWVFRPDRGSPREPEEYGARGDRIGGDRTAGDSPQQRSGGAAGADEPTGARAATDAPAAVPRQ